MIRHIKWFIQRITRGFDNRELWNLDDTFTQYILPRLKAFRDMQAKEGNGYPAIFSDWKDEGDGYCMGLTKQEWKDHGYIGGGMERWIEILDCMIFAFEVGRGYTVHDNEVLLRVNQGMEYFSKYYFNLWD